ncbi:MAG: glycosyltransferase family 9 protein [Pseudomonadota bacterium]|nr:glycosyltransferase family 9 protein [Pseudomonadota bacterium]
MKSSYYSRKWSTLKKKGAAADDLRRLARQIAYSFMDYYLQDCRYADEYIDLLCEMMTFSDDPDLTHHAAAALFSIIVESLCDDFEELQTITYNKIMVQVITFCRRVPGGKDLDLTLKKFGIQTADDLLARINRVRANHNSLSRHRQVRKILLLSRVTIGADIAVTSVIFQRLSKVFPEAEFVLIGGSKLEELYGGNPRIRFRQLAYSRKGGLLERLSSWYAALEVIQQEEAAAGGENEVVLIDPDSRISQLGILPLVPLDRYYFFDSRSGSSFNYHVSMPELANSWLDTILDEKDFCYPAVWFPEPLQEIAGKYCHLLRRRGAQRIIVVNFGVGGNPRKRVGRRFEENLILTLLREPNTVILLDKGFGKQELDDANAMLDAIEKHGYATIHTVFGVENNDGLASGVIGFQSRIGEIGALIANSDEFIGYDSACQHISVALEIPCITIFAGSNNMRFIRRWSAYGRRSSHIVHVDTLTDAAAIDVEGIITRVMHHRKGYD